MITRFEDIIAWQKAKILTLAVYHLMKPLRDYAFKDQLQRCSVSIMNNLAEGFDRRNPNELRYFFTISKGSCAELRSMLYLAKELHYVTEEDFSKLYNLSTEISKLISAFIISIGKTRN